MISDSTVVKFRRPGSSSARLSFDTFLLGRATIAWVMGTPADDVPALSTLGRVVRTMGSTFNVLFTRDGQDLLRILAMKATT
jgi:hypothetical protein